MTKWMKDGLIGWGATVVVGLVVSVAIKAPYPFLSNLAYILAVGLFAIPGGILLGRKSDGWILPAVGGLISAVVFYYVLSTVFGAF